MRITYQALSIILFGLSVSACAPYPIDPVPVSGTVVIQSRPVVRHYPRTIIKPNRVVPHSIRPRHIRPVRPIRYSRPVRKDIACTSRGMNSRYCNPKR